MEYKLNSNFSYYVDIFHIRLINMKEHKQLTLRYPDAAIFALLIKRYTQRKMVNMISEIAHVTTEHAEGLISDTMRMLKKHNVLEK